jgi:amino acid adenylation domain-containing protein
MLKDSRAGFLVTDDIPRDDIGAAFDGEIIRLNSPEILRQKCTKPVPLNTSANLAYIIYTSGSTGKPKGMLIEHRNVVNYMLSSLDLLQLTPGDTRTQQSSFSFDQFVEETYSILIAGGRLLLINKYDVRDIERFKKIIHQNKVTVLTTTPPLLNEINKYPLAPSVRKVLVGGDELKKEHVSHIVRHVPVDNFYGPTETTASATHYRYTGDARSTIPIGKPRSNYQVYILDRQYHIMPPGVPGEICISGDGVGRGYLNRPELTREKFVENPFLEAVPMYKSGDMGRWLADGNIEFSGRLDKQVKIRGYRIEPGEIENQLRKLRGIREAVVAVCAETPRQSIQDENKFLCAYIVSDQEINSTELRKQLTGQLPDYMIPSYFMRLDHFPVTANGKIDKKALPHPKVKAAPAAAAPRSELEEKLTAIWSEVLELEKKAIGIEVDFFELGGHSLKATKMVSKMHKELNVKIPLNEVFRNPTIKGIAAYIKKTAGEKYTAIVPQPPGEYYELSSAQSRLYFLHQLNPETVSYNMPQFAILKGILEKKRLQETFLRLIQRHESLRTSFEKVKGKPRQKIHRHAAFQLQYFDLHAGNPTAGEKSEKSIIMDFAKPFRLSHPPLMRAGLIKTKPDEHIWMVDIHHIISDGVSMEVLMKDFMALYEGRPLKELKIHYKDFAEWQNRLFRADFLEKQQAYWLNIFKDPVPALNLPLDFERPPVRNFIGSYVSLELEESLCKGIHMLAQQTECTLYMILLAVYNVLLAKYTGKDDIAVGSPVTGRTHADLETVIGMFVNMLTMRNHPGKNKTFNELLAEVKKNAINAYENQDYPFPELVKQLGIKRESGKNPLFDTVFQLNHGESGPIRIGNLQLLPYDSRITISQFDLIMGVIEYTGKISLRMFYPTDLFKSSTVEKMVKRYVEILKQVTYNKEIKLRDIYISSDLLVSSSAASQDAGSDFGF